MDDQKLHDDRTTSISEKNHTQTLVFKSIGRKLFVIVLCESSNVLTELRLMKYNACSVLFSFSLYLCVCRFLLISLCTHTYIYIPLFSVHLISFCGHLPLFVFLLCLVKHAQIFNRTWVGPRETSHILRKSLQWFGQNGPGPNIKTQTYNNII